MNKPINERWTAEDCKEFGRCLISKLQELIDNLEDREPDPIKRMQELVGIINLAKELRRLAQTDGEEVQEQTLLDVLSQAGLIPPPPPTRPIRRKI
jgi:hypothetical protein